MKTRDKTLKHARNRGYDLVQILRNGLICKRQKKIRGGGLESKTILIDQAGGVEVLARSIKPATFLDKFLSY